MKKLIDKETIELNIVRKLNEWAEREHNVSPWIVNLSDYEDYMIAKAVYGKERVKHDWRTLDPRDSYFVVKKSGLQHVNVNELWASLKVLGVL